MKSGFSCYTNIVLSVDYIFSKDDANVWYIASTRKVIATQ